MKQNKYINPFTQVLLCEPAWNVMLQATGTIDEIAPADQGGNNGGQGGGGFAPGRIYI